MRTGHLFSGEEVLAMIWGEQVHQLYYFPNQTSRIQHKEQNQSVPGGTNFSKEVAGMTREHDA